MLGKEAMDKLANSKVAVFGVGSGVGVGVGLSSPDVSPGVSVSPINQTVILNFSMAYSYAVESS